MSHATPHRLLYFFVAFVLLMFFGLIYAWSLFVDHAIAGRSTLCHCKFHLRGFYL